MKIDFTTLLVGDRAPFSQDGVTIRSWDSGGNELSDYVIDPGLGYNTAYRTECTLPESDPVTVSLMIAQPVTVQAYDQNGQQIGKDQNLGAGQDCPPFTALGLVALIKIVAQDPRLPGANIAALDWTPVVKTKSDQLKKKR